MVGKPYNAYEAAQAQFDQAAATLNLEPAVREMLRHPGRCHEFRFPVRMDDGTVRVFNGFRVQHNNARGPCKGGIRFHPQETLDTIRALAMWMTWRCAIVDIPLGGSMGGVVCDPHHLTSREQEGVCRGWVRQLASDLGPHTDIPEPEVMTSAQHMLWMLDEYEAIHGQKSPGMITGKPVGMGGSLGRTEATGYGLVFTVREALKELGLVGSQTRASVQGFGKVAQHAIRLYQQIGGTVVCVSCWDHNDQVAYTYARKDGIDLDALVSIADPFGGLDQARAREHGYDVLPAGAWLEQHVDILIPAALENQITLENVEAIQSCVKLIAEGASGPTTPEAESSIIDRGIFLIPHCLATAGGVTCSYFEQVQSNMNYYWARDEVLGKLDVKMTAAFEMVCDVARRMNLTMREAAYHIAVTRVAQACRDRGWV